MDNLAWKYRALIGGAGALAPSVVTLAAMDLRTTLQAADWFTYLGMAVRIAALFALGAAVAAFHTSENVPFKLFELGIGAPAIVTTALVGAHVDGQTALRMLTPSTVYAAERRVVQAAGQPSAVDQFLRGLLGGPGPQYMVVAFPEGRGVRVDGVEMGRTNEVLRLEPGVHTVTLAPPFDFTPSERTVRLERTTARNPTRVTFERRGLK